MENLFIGIKWIHIIAGGVSLLFGLLAIILRKKVKIHRPVGKVYFISMTIIFISSCFMSIYHFNPFLFCVGFFTYYACLTAFRSLKLKKIHLGQKPELIDWLIEIFFGSMHISFLIFGIYNFIQNSIELGIVSVVFAIFGLNGNWQTYQRISGKKTPHNYWLISHIGGMLGSYIGAITAFVVNNSTRIPLPPIVLWIGPTLFIVPFIIYEIRKYKAKKIDF